MGKDALHSVVEIIQTSLRILAAVFFVVAGTFHFLKPEPYRQIIPPQFPAPQLLVIISGIAEIAGGIGLLIPSFRRWLGAGGAFDRGFSGELLYGGTSRTVSVFSLAFVGTPAVAIGVPGLGMVCGDSPPLPKGSLESI